jgi:hypothetical protein
MATAAEDLAMAVPAHLLPFGKDHLVVCLPPVGCVTQVAFLTEIRFMARQTCPRIRFRLQFMVIEPRVSRFVRRRFLRMALLAEVQSVFMAGHTFSTVFKRQGTVFLDPIVPRMFLPPRQDTPTMTSFAVPGRHDLRQIFLSVPESMLA